VLFSSAAEPDTGLFISRAWCEFEEDGVAEYEIFALRYATHDRTNLEGGNPYPIVVDVAAMMESWSRLRELADSDAHIVPGHDPLVGERYPSATVGDEEATLLYERPR
jgi:glyoxylase-like metal-dependent hydrolase (beta-lactamase superfamily II)